MTQVKPAPEGRMLTVLRVHLPSEIPIVGCEIKPYVLLRLPDGGVISDDVSEAAPVDGYFMRYKWYRIQSDQRAAICSMHPTEQATLQCLGCLKSKIPVAKSYHCSGKCFLDAWQHHRVLHERAISALNENGAEEEELFRFGSGGSGALSAVLSGSASNLVQSSVLNNGPTPVYPTGTEKNSGETWFEVGRSRTYTGTADDIGHVLRFECIIVDAETRGTVGTPTSVMTSRVIPAPTPTPRRLLPVNAADAMGHFDLDTQTSSFGSFTVLSYNILADAYATSDTYSYCPTWAISWAYRRQNLLREIIGYHADIICLQEVQHNHFEEFFAPELDKHGYQALYKKRTTEVYTGSSQAIDGCATFFRRDRFLHVKKYEVEFNKAARSLTAIIPAAQKKLALTRLIKDNIALIAVLEAKFNNHGTENPGRRQLLCVANTHINIHHDLKDVKLWQVHTLLKGLEKIAVSADIPMLVCGAFNSAPGSTSHGLLANGKVDLLHPDLAVDPLGILRPPSKLTHKLPLVSAYSSFARMAGAGYDLDHQRRRMDPATNEPLFTNCTKDFTGTSDYIFYTADSLTVESLLELLDEDSLRKDTALPSPEWSSDHIALLAEFQCIPRNRR